MAVQKSFSKKKVRIDSAVKKQQLGHKAIKSLVKLSKTVRSNIIRKYLRKVKNSKENDQLVEKLLTRISELKVRQI